MIYLNEYIRQNWKEGNCPLHVALCNMLNAYPEMYAFSSIQDFLQNKHEIKITKTLLPPGRKSRGRALIMFESSLDLRIKSSKKRIVSYVKDLTGTLDIDVSYAATEGSSKPYFYELIKDIVVNGALNDQDIGKEIRGLNHSMRIYSSVFSYRPRNGINLLLFGDHGPPSEDFDEKEGLLERMLLAPAAA